VTDYPVPEKKDVIRAHSYISGWIFIPDKENPKKTTILIIARTNLKGYFIFIYFIFN
jgi:hypothetical protein